MPTKKTTMRKWLEVRAEDGTTGFVSVERILASPDLRQRCLEKRALRRVIKQLSEAGILEDVIAAASTPARAKH
jgi:hypothetical protein